MRSIDIETEKNTINLTRSQITEGKIVSYGKDNDYPTIIASLIENSQTAKASASVSVLLMEISTRPIPSSPAFSFALPLSST